MSWFFYRTLRLLPYSMCANSEGSCETAQMLARAFAGRLCDKDNNLMSWLNLSSILEILLCIKISAKRWQAFWKSLNLWTLLLKCRNSSKTLKATFSLRTWHDLKETDNDNAFIEIKLQHITYKLCKSATGRESSTATYYSLCKVF